MMINQRLMFLYGIAIAALLFIFGFGIYTQLYTNLQENGEKMENLLALQREYHEQQEIIKSQIQQIQQLSKVLRKNSDDNLNMVAKIADDVNNLPDQLLISSNFNQMNGVSSTKGLVKPTLNPENNATLHLEIDKRISSMRKSYPNTCFPLNSTKTICLPNFVCIGTMKSGTTFLDHYLQKHPLVAKHTKKEIWFFNSYYQNGIEWYANHFEPVMNFENQKLIGESTPFYINNPHTAARMFVTLKNVKLIVTMRDPVDRALSQYFFSQKWLDINKKPPLAYTFEELIHQEMDLIDTCLRGNERFQQSFAEFKSKQNQGLLEDNAEFQEQNPFYTLQSGKNWTFYKDCMRCEKCFPTANILHTSGHPTFGMIAKSLYYEQLEHWLNFFPLEQFLFIRYEDLSTNPEKVLREMEEFLGLPPHDYGQFIPKNVVPHEKMDSDLEKELRAYFKPHNQKLYKLLNRDFGWD